MGDSTCAASDIGMGHAVPDVDISRSIERARGAYNDQQCWISADPGETAAACRGG